MTAAGSTRSGRRSKAMTLADAVGAIPDGAHVVIGGAALHMHPMAAIRELIRQRRRDLVVLGEIQGLEADMLAGAGVAKRIESAGVGLERYGLARNFRRKVESQELTMVDYTDTMSMERIVARRENFTFWPVSFLGGSDIAAHIPDIVEFDCPITGRPLLAMPPARVDVALIHMPYADQRGNVLIQRRSMMPQGQDLLYARTADRTYVTVERIVSDLYVRQNAWATAIPSYQVAGVIEAPFGAHPSSMPDFYDLDDTHLMEYVEASKTQETFDEYLNEYVFTRDGHVDYLERVGVRNLLATLNINVSL
jgi:glutaconate CoA-transferase, subunit A